MPSTFYALLAIALPAVEANLVNYLWPLLVVVLAPVVLKGVALRPVVTGRPLSWSVALAALLIISAAVMGTRARN